MTQTAAAIWRKYAIDGVPGSGPNQPIKTDIQAWGTYLESLLNGSAAGLAYASFALISADLSPAANALATVYGDTTPANNGMYVKVGASGSGAWTRIGDLPNGIIRLTVTGGTGDAIIATSPETPTVPGAKLYLLTVAASNTVATTIAVNGALAVPIKNAFGVDLAAGSLVIGSQVLMAWAVDHYQLLISAVVDGTAILASVVASASAASTSATAAASSASALGNQVHQYDTRALAVAATIPTGVLTVKVTRYATGHPLSFATYVPGTSSGPGAFQEAGGHYWQLDLSGGVIFASWFGAIGDDATNDYTALQAGITASINANVEFHLNPSRKYYVSGNDLTIAIPLGINNFHFYGNGSQIRTDPTQSRSALIINNIIASESRTDQNRKILISGLTINHYNNANALFGINVITSPHVTIRDCSFNAGSDTGVANQSSYACVAFTQSVVTDPNYGSFWCRVQNSDFIGGSSSIPRCVWINGGHNAMTLDGNTFSACSTAIFVTSPSTGSNSNEAVIANGVRIINNDFEGCATGIFFQGVTGWSFIDGWMILTNRIESISSFFLNLSSGTMNTDNTFAPLILGPNNIDSGSWTHYISNGNNLTIDVRDEGVRRATIAPSSLAAGATTTIGSVVITPAVVGDQAWVETNADLLGLIATAFVSATNTVSIRLTNPTSALVSLGSVKWTVRIRRQV